MQIDVSGWRTPLHFFNAHLGTAYVERRHQATSLVASDHLPLVADFELRAD